MSTAIIGVGKIGQAVATHLTEGGETVVLAASKPSQAEQLARDLGPSASAADVSDAIDHAGTVSADTSPTRPTAPPTVPSCSTRPTTWPTRRPSA
jgi:Trk K+ transport system NAD-binding subunit